MLEGLRYVVDRWRHPRSRADELARLRARFVVASTPAATAEQRELAAELRRLRCELIAAFGPLGACADCGRGHPLPGGAWDGGNCCGGNTLELFNADEVAALAVGGTRGTELVAPRSEHHGCAFRGPRGCSLQPADRPNICVRHICWDLRRELKARDDWPQVAALAGQLRDTFERFDLTRMDLAAPPRREPRLESAGEAGGRARSRTADLAEDGGTGRTDRACRPTACGSLPAPAGAGLALQPVPSDLPQACSARIDAPEGCSASPPEGAAPGAAAAPATTSGGPACREGR